MRYAEDSEIVYLPLVVDEILPPDVMLPSQMPSRGNAYNPERQLIWEVLNSALDDLRASYIHQDSVKLKARRAEVFAWLGGVDALVPFALVCEVLCVDEGILRNCIMTACARAALGIAPFPRYVVSKPGPSRIVENRHRETAHARRARHAAVLSTGE